MKKALMSAILVFVFCLAMLLGTTYAWFTETIAVEGNAIRLGILDVEFMVSDPEEGILDDATWYDLSAQGAKIFDNNYLYPGGRDSRMLKIENKSNFPIAFRINTANTYYTNQAVLNSIRFSIDGNGNAVMNDNVFNVYVLLEVGDVIEFELSYLIDELLGNEGMDQYITFDIILEAVQLGYVISQEGILLKASTNENTHRITGLQVVNPLDYMEYK
jgi:hypothetical protein